MNQHKLKCHRLFNLYKVTQVCEFDKISLYCNFHKIMTQVIHLVRKGVLRPSRKYLICHKYF